MNTVKLELVMGYIEKLGLGSDISIEKATEIYDTDMKLKATGVKVYGL